MQIYKKKVRKNLPQKEENIPFHVATLGKDKRPDACRQNSINGRRTDGKFFLEADLEKPWLFGERSSRECHAPFGVNLTNEPTIC